MIVDPADDVCQVGFWIDAVELGGFNDGVEASRPLAACIGAAEQIVFASQDRCQCRPYSPQKWRLKIPQSEVASVGHGGLGTRPPVAHGTLDGLREGMGGQAWGAGRDPGFTSAGIERVGYCSGVRARSQDCPALHRAQLFADRVPGRGVGGVQPLLSPACLAGTIKRPLWAA
jgi:hypothetical protein